MSPSTSILSARLQGSLPLSQSASGPWRGRWSAVRSGRRDGPVFGAEVSHQLRDLLIGERVAKGRHFLPAVGDLCRNFVGWPQLVLAQIDERRRLLAARPAYAVAIRATLVAKQNCAGLRAGLGIGTCVHRDNGADNNGGSKAERSQMKNHKGYFLMDRCIRASINWW
jgi:hypothetical protein